MNLGKGRYRLSFARDCARALSHGEKLHAAQCWQHSSTAGSRAILQPGELTLPIAIIYEQA